MVIPSNSFWINRPYIMQRQTAVRLYNSNQAEPNFLVRFYKWNLNVSDPQHGSNMYSQERKPTENVLVLFLARCKPKTVTKQLNRIFKKIN